MTTYKPLVLIAGLDQQLDSADALDVSTIDTATLNLTGNLTVTGSITGDLTVNAAISATGNLSCNTLYTNSGAVIGATVTAASFSTSGNISGNVANITTLNMDGYLEGYAGSPSNNDVLTWVTANSRAEFAAPTGSGGETISSNTTYYVATTGNDTTGDGTANTPWATVHKALDYLNGKIIDEDVFVTIELSDGTHTYTSPVEVLHPYGHRIIIKGTTVISATTSNIVSISGTAPNRTITFTVNSTSNFAVGDLVRVVPVSGGSYPRLVGGTTKVVSVDSATQVTLNFGQHTTTYAPSGAVVANLTVFKTKLVFDGCHGFLVHSRCSLGLIDDLSIEGTSLSYTAIRAGGIQIQLAGRVVCGTDIAIRYFGIGIAAYYGGVVSARYASIGDCYWALSAQFAGIISAPDAISNWSSSFAVYTSAKGFIFADRFLCVGGESQGIVGVLNSGFYGGACYILANAQQGVWSQEFTFFHLENSFIQLNGSHGVYCQQGSFVAVSGSNISENGGTGVYCTGDSSVRAASCTIQSNGGGGVLVEHDSYVNRASSTINGNTSFQTSPSTIPSSGNYEGVIV